MTFPNEIILTPETFPEKTLHPYGLYVPGIIPPPPISSYALMGDATAFGGMPVVGLTDRWIDLTATQYLTTPALANVTDGKMLFSIWMNCPSYVASQQTWFNANNAGSSRVLQALIQVDSAGSRLYFEGSETTARNFAGSSGQAPLVPDAWTNIIWACNGTGYQWENWINGVLMPKAGYSNHGSYNMAAPTYWGRNGSGSQQTTAKASSGLLLSEYFGQHFGASVIADIYAAGPFGKQSEGSIGWSIESEWWVA